MLRAKTVAQEVSYGMLCQVRSLEFKETYVRTYIHESLMDSPPTANPPLTLWKTVHSLPLWQVYLDPVKGRATYVRMYRCLALSASWD